MSPQSLQTVYTVLDVLALLPIAWVTFYAVAAIFTSGSRITSGTGGGLVWAASIAWLVVRYLGVVA